MKYDRHAAHIYDVYLPRRVKHFDEGHGSFHDFAVSFASNVSPPSSVRPFLASVSRKKHFRLRYERVAKIIRNIFRNQYKLSRIFLHFI